MPQEESRHGRVERKGDDVGIKQQRPWGRGARCARAATLGIALALLVAVAASAASSVTIGDVTITLQSCRYYARRDFTRFTYEVKGVSSPSCAYWILGSCDEFRNALWWTSDAFTWGTSPMVGLKVTPTKKKQTFEIDASGRWSAVAVPVGVYVAGQFLQGWVDGPACVELSLSVGVVAGADVVFPQVAGPGLFPALNGTTLRVQSTSPGWTLSSLATFGVPAGGSEAVVERILEITVGGHSNNAGTTNVSVGYALRVAQEDFGSLPEGTYEITITYTVVLD
jgi:hypothetical protein